MLVGPKYFPPLEPAGDVQAHLAYHFGHGSVSSVDLLYRLAFASAQRELWIQNPYLAVDDDVSELLGETAKRGVDVRLMLPGEITDVQAVRHAGHALFDPLLAPGVKICEYQPTLNHQKIVIVDGLWSHIGSTNLDNRSFETQRRDQHGHRRREDRRRAARGVPARLKACEPIGYRQWKSRAWSHKLRDWASYRFHDLL